VLRTIVRTAAVLAVLGVLVVAADRGSRVLVTRTVSVGLTQTQQLRDPARVTIEGTPFLTQVVRGRYDRVDVSLAGVPVGSGLVVERLDTTLTGVHAPALPALRGSLRILQVDSGQATTTGTFHELEGALRQALGAGALTVRLSPAAADRMLATVLLDTPAGRLTVRAQLQVVVDDGAVVARLLPRTVTGLPAALSGSLAERLDLSRVMPSLPFGFRADTVVVDDRGLRLRASGNDLAIPL